LAGLLGALSQALRFIYVAHLRDAVQRVATAILAFFALVSGVFAFLAFRKQSHEVRAIERQVRDQEELTRQQAELLKVQSGQLEVQRQQFDEERETNALQRQDLRESLKERVSHRRIADREQADKVGFRLVYTEFPEFSLEDASEFAVAPGELVHMAIVSNESRRPIRDVVCKAGSWSEPDSSPFPPPGYSDKVVMIGRVADQRSGARRKQSTLIDPIPVSRVMRIRPGESYGFVFEITASRELMDSEVVKFTDDAGLHWCIDHDMHLKQILDRD
jgi:hypothetical protein